MTVFYIAERLCYRVAFLLPASAIAAFWRPQTIGGLGDSVWHAFVRDRAMIRTTRCLPGK